MYLPVCVITVLLFRVASAAERNSKCVTPNGEHATCITISECTVINRAITYLGEKEIEFARKSQCGYENEPLVCCGKVGQFTTTISPDASTTEATYVVESESFPEHIDNLLLPDNTLCGLQVIEDRKSDSNVPQVLDFPWMVALKYVKDDGSDGGFKCTGTLIASKYVLTTAQCVDIPGFKLKSVRLGEWNFSSSEYCYQQGTQTECAKPKVYQVEKQIRHEFYDGNIGKNNIALLRLKQRVTYSNVIRALCLPPAEHPAPNPGSRMDSSGWGIARNVIRQPPLVKYKLPRFMAEQGKCSQKYKNSSNPTCFNNANPDVPCEDPGTPLMRNYIKTDATDEEQFYMEGIVVGSDCVKDSQPCAYVKVSKYINWILSKLEF